MISALLAYYAALSGTSVPTFRDSSDIYAAFCTDVSGQIIGPIFKGQAVQQNYHSTLCNIPEERRSHVHRGGSLKSRIKKAIEPFLEVQVTCMMRRKMNLGFWWRNIPLKRPRGRRVDNIKMDLQEVG
jgi:hypothetical protein